MRKCYKIIALLLFIFAVNAYAATINDSQIIKSDSQVYTLFQELDLRNKIWSFTENTPISVGELKFYLKKYDYEALDEVSKGIYNQIKEFLYEDSNLFPSEDVQMDLNFRANLELYYKTNKDIPYNFNYNYKDNLLTAPLFFGFGNLFAFGGEFFYGKNYIAAKKNNNYCNIPVDFSNLKSVKAMEFWFPTFAYGSTGKTFDNWGYDLQIGKMGKTIGDTLSGSIIYNKTFETDAFVDFDLYSDFLKYTLSVIQISSNRMDSYQEDNTDRFMYLHQVDLRLFKKLKYTIIEGSMTANPFSLRYLNPLATMHQFGGWTDYISDENKAVYIESNFCAYLAMMLDYIPIQNLRMYVLYSQVEMQQSWERNNSWGGRYYPNSIALQPGIEYFINLNNDSKIKLGLEGVYTSPYMYVKQLPSSSLYRVRKDMQTKEYVYSWIGTPFGPDCVACQFRTQYIPNNKWNLEFDYVLSAKGRDTDIFNETVTDDDGNVWYKYYPSVFYKLYKLGKLSKDDMDSFSDEELFAEATRMFPDGIPVITNEISLSGNYKINDHFELSGQTVFTYILNNNHEYKNNDFGVQFSMACTYTLF